LKKQSSLYQKIAGTFDICCSTRFDTNHIQQTRDSGAPGLLTGFFYAAEVVETAVAEAVFHRPLFYWESPDTPWPTNPGEYTAFATEFATDRAVDLSQPPLVADRASWTHLMDYMACLDLADVIRAAALEAIRYESVRDPQQRANIALLTCRVFTQNDVVDRQTWHFHFTNSGVRSIREAPSATIQFDRNIFAADPRIAPMKWDRASKRLTQRAPPI